MRFGFVIPGGHVHDVVQMARDAEAAGWDAVFIPDCIYVPAAESSGMPVGFDPWVTLAAIAMATERVKIGAMLTPLSRRRPWKLARETTTLDHLSNGRLILPVGLGALDDAGFGAVGELTDRKARAELLDEALEIITGLWSGEKFSFEGKHFKISGLRFEPRPLQSPRIPIWVVGAWPRPKSMVRVLRYDGLIPTKIEAGGSFGTITPEDIREIKVFIEERRDSASAFDIVWEGETPGEDRDKAMQIVGPYAEAGITWWLESMWSPADGLSSVRTRINQGPPTLG